MEVKLGQDGSKHTGLPSSWDALLLSFHIYIYIFFPPAYWSLTMIITPKRHFYYTYMHVNVLIKVLFFSFPVEAWHNLTKSVK